jgi:predicted PurR-regulated permease PerM
MAVDPEPLGLAGANVEIPATTPQRIGRIVLALGLILLGLWILQDFLAALAWAAVFAIAFWPAYEYLLRAMPARGERITPPLLITLLVGVVFIGPVVYLAVLVAREVHIVLDLVSAARQHGFPAPGWVAELPLVGHALSEWWRDHLGDPYTAEALFGNISKTMTTWVREYGGEVAHRLTTFAFMLLILFFLFRHGTRFAAQLLRVSDRLLGVSGERVARQMILAVHGTVNGLVLVGLAEGLILGIVYALTGVPHAVLFGVATAILAVIPFGAPVIFCVAALVLFAQGSTAAAIVVIAAGFAVLFLADHLVRPFLIGGAVHLPFLWVLLGILGGIETFGILGLFLGPAVMAALISLWREATAAPATPALVLPPAGGGRRRGD